MNTFIIEMNTEFELEVSENEDLIFPIQIHICFFIEYILLQRREEGDNRILRHSDV